MLNSLPWGYIPSCAPLPDLLVMVGRLLAIPMTPSSGMWEHPPL